MRIVAGRFKGRTLRGPAGPGVRPTSDGLRETLFNVIGGRVADARVLDAFAGTGAVGLEALSRGARRVTFVERDRRAARVIHANVADCGVTDAAEIVESDVDGALPRLGRSAPFHIVFADPPYEVAALDGLLGRLAPLVAPGGLLVLEHSRRRIAPDAAGGLVRQRILVAGDSALSFYAAAPAG